MQKLIFSFLFSLILLPARAQNSVRATLPKLYQPKETSIYYKLGERIIQIKTFQYGNVKDIVYINLHDDEITAVNGARKVLEKKGGLLIKIENYRTRNIKFKLQGKYYTVDPNRMFSRMGIAKSLLVFGRTSPKAIDEIEKFAKRILQLLPPNPSCIIALHNNSNGKFSINTYLPGGEREKDAKALNINQEQDADDFYLTTDSIIFNRLAVENYNMILQDNEKAKKDGSLSIYCGEKNINYINCETEHGSQPEYDEMIMAAVSLLDGKNTDSNFNQKKRGVIVTKNNPDMLSYKYRIIPAGGHAAPKPDTEILFGDKKVGMVSSVITDSAWAIAGKLDIDKDFPLYTNMDFFLLLFSNNTARLDIRMDPTRKKELMNPGSATISVSTKRIN